MAGRKPLTLTNNDYFDILEHIYDLPFKRKCEQKLLDIRESSNKKGDLSFFTPEDFEVLKKCRYERNAYMKRQTLLQLILATDSTKRTTTEQKVAVLSNQKQIGVVSGNGKYSTLRIFTPTSFNDIQHGIFA